MNTTAYELWLKIKVSKDGLIPLKDESTARAMFELINAGFLSEKSYIDSKDVLHCILPTDE